MRNSDWNVGAKEDAGVALLNLYNFIKSDNNSAAKGLLAMTDVSDKWVMFQKVYKIISFGSLTDLCPVSDF